MSVFGPRYSWGQPGCFLFKLTRLVRSTRARVPDGVYDLVVTADRYPAATKLQDLSRLTIHNRAGW